MGDSSPAISGRTAADIPVANTGAGELFLGPNAVAGGGKGGVADSGMAQTPIPADPALSALPVDPALMALFGDPAMSIPFANDPLGILRSMAGSPMAPTTPSPALSGGTTTGGTAADVLARATERSAVHRAEAEAAARAAAGPETPAHHRPYQNTNLTPYQTRNLHNK